MLRDSSVLQSEIIDSSQTIGLGLQLASSVVIERDAGTPAGDPVVVSLDGVVVTSATALTVQDGAKLAIKSPLSASALEGFSIGSSGTLKIGPAIPLALASPVSFDGPNGRLVLGSAGGALNFTDPVSGFSASDTVDFRGVTAATSATYANGVLSLLDGSAVVATALVSGSFGAKTLTVQADGLGGFSTGDNVGDVSHRLSGANSDYQIAALSPSVDVIQDTVAGRDGTSNLANGQTLGFSDGIGLVDPSGNAETLVHLYQAVLGRAPDTAGLLALTGQYDDGSLTTATVGDSFVNSAEFQGHYGSLTNMQFISVLDQNTGNQNATAFNQTELAALNSGVSRGQVATQFAETSSNVVQTLGFSGDQYYGEIYRLYPTLLDRTVDSSGL